MIEGYRRDLDPDIQDIIGSLTKWKCFDEGDGVGMCEPDDGLSGEENEVAGERWYEKQMERAEKEHSRFMRKFAKRFDASLEECFGSKAPGMTEYLRLWT